MLKQVDYLIEARNLIADPEHWTQGDWARDAHKNPVNPESPNAVCWCATGALRKVGTNLSLYEVFALQVLLGDEAERSTEQGFRIIDTNDYLGHETVIGVYDRVIQRLQEMPS